MNLTRRKLNTFKIFLLLQLTIVLFQACLKKNEEKRNDMQRKPYTILGLGDSITEGNSPNKSYLFSLWEKLYKAGYLTEFIGPNTHQCEIGSIRNAGFGGKNAEYLDVHIDSIYTKHPADIVLLHTGHNHFTEEKPIEGIIAAQKSIISKIVAINPNVKIFIAQVITSGKLPKYSYIPELNKQISHLADQLQKDGLPIILVDQSKDFNWEIHCLKDKVHPNSKGAELMANTWFKSIDKELKKSIYPIAYKPEITTYKTFDDSELKLHIFKPVVKKIKGNDLQLFFSLEAGGQLVHHFNFIKSVNTMRQKVL
jgi:acetyl esterase